MAQLNNHLSWWWQVRNNENNDQTMLVITIFVLILAVLGYKFKLSKTSTSSPSLPPGPRSWPIVGYLPFLGPELHKQFTTMALTYGPIFKCKLGSKLYIVVNTPELAKVVVRDQDETFSDRDQTIAPLEITYGGQDIVLSNYNNNWRKLRKIFVHEMLSRKNLQTTSLFRRDELRKTIKNVFHKIGKEINIREIAFFTEANVITRMVCGNSMDLGVKNSDLLAELDVVTTNITRIFGQVNLSDLFPCLAPFDLQGIKRDMRKQSKKMDQILTSIVNDRIEWNSKRSHGGAEDFLQILLNYKDEKDGSSLNMAQIKALLLDVMIGGTETTAISVEWVMANILYHPKVKKRVEEELIDN